MLKAIDISGYKYIYCGDESGIAEGTNDENIRCKWMQISGYCGDEGGYCGMDK